MTANDSTEIDYHRMLAVIADAQSTGDRLAAELERLGRGVEKIAAKYGADYPEVTAALRALLSGPAVSDHQSETLPEGGA